LVLLPRGWGVLGVLVATAAGNLFASVMLVARIRRNVAAIGAAGVEAGTAEARATDGAGVTALRLFRFSAPLVAIGFLIQVVWRQSETLFLGHFRTAAEAGFFDLAYRLPQTALEFVPTAVWPLVMAGFSEVYARNASDLRVAIDRYYRMLFLLCMPICVTGVVLGGRLITVFYGTEMEPAAVPAQLFFAVFTVVPVPGGRERRSGFVDNPFARGGRRHRAGVAGHGGGTAGLSLDRRALRRRRQDPVGVYRQDVPWVRCRIFAGAVRRLRGRGDAAGRCCGRCWISYIIWIQGVSGYR
jgi:hypothetical protein